jgi:hypothetical protein
MRMLRYMPVSCSGDQASVRLSRATRSPGFTRV